MPRDDGFGLENEQCRAPIVPQAGEPNPADSIRAAETKLVATARTLWDQKLITEGKNLNLQSILSELDITAGEGAQQWDLGVVISAFVEVLAITLWSLTDEEKIT